MQKHLYFWLGVFLTLICGLAVAFGFIDVAVEHTKTLILLGVGAGCSMIFLLLVFLLFRRRIFRSVFGSVEGTLNEVAGSVGSLISNASEGNTQMAGEHAGAITKTLLAWYSWSTLYRWVVSTCIAIIVGLGGFAGTTLLMDQNNTLDLQTRVFEAQNSVLESQLELEAVQVTSVLRDLLKPSGVFRSVPTLSAIQEMAAIDRAASSDPALLQMQDTELRRSPDVICIVRFEDTDIEEIALASKIEEVRRLGQKESLKARIGESLTAIVMDENAMAFAALVTMSELGIMPDQEELTFYNIRIGRSINLEFDSPILIRIRDSIVDNIACEGCRVAIYTSILDGTVPADSIVGWSATRSFLRKQQLGEPENSDERIGRLKSAFDVIANGALRIESSSNSSQLVDWRKMKRIAPGDNYVVLSDNEVSSGCDRDLLTCLPFFGPLAN